MAPFEYQGVTRELARIEGIIEEDFDCMSKDCGQCAGRCYEGTVTPFDHQPDTGESFYGTRIHRMGLMIPPNDVAH